MPGTTMPTFRVVRWYDQPALPATPPPGPLDVAVSRLMWRVFAVKPRWVAAMTRMLGMADGSPLTFRETAALIGYTGSRVGQVYHQLSRAAVTVGVPRSLHRALARLSQGPVRTADDAVRQLVDGRTLTGPLSCEAIAAIAGLWRLPAGFQVRATPERERLVVPDDAADDVDAWLAELASRCAHTPVSITAVQRPHRVPRQLAATLAATHPRLTGSGGAVWPAAQLPLAGRLAARALGAGRQSLASLRDAMRQRLAEHYALTAPPVEVLRAYLEAMPWAEVRRGQVSLVGEPPVPPNNSDRLLLDRLPPGETARWTELVALLAAGGYSTLGSAGSVLRLSPVVAQTADGAYFRRGTPPRPAGPASLPVA